MSAQSPAVDTTARTTRPAAGGPDRLIQLGLGFWPAQVLLTALELGVYEALADGPADAETLRARVGVHERGAADFFDCQVALGLLEREDGLYRNSPDVAAYLADPTADSYAGGPLELAARLWWKMWGDLGTGLRTGRPQNPLPQGDDFFSGLYADPELARVFQRAMTGASLMAARALAEKFPWERFASVVDVGCSEGTALSHVLRAHPHLTGIGFDLPPIRKRFAKTVARTGCDGRMYFAPGSFLTDPLPGADVLVLGRVLHDWDVATRRMLLRKAYDAVAPGGAVVVYESFIDDERRTNSFGMLLSLHMQLLTEGGSDYTAADCVGWLSEAGFHDCEKGHLAGPASFVIGWR